MSRRNKPKKEPADCRNWIVVLGSKFYGPYTLVDAETVRSFLRAKNPSKRTQVKQATYMLPRKAAKSLEKLLTAKAAKE